MDKAVGLAYEDLGSGDTIVFIHGGIIAPAFALLVREEALAGYRRIRLHRRGFGGSDLAGGAWRVEDHAADVAALLHHLGIDRAHVVGHSYGGLVAIQFALDHPDTVTSLNLLEPALYQWLDPSLMAGMSERIAGHLARAQSGDTVGAIGGFMRGAEGPDWQRVDETIPGAVAQAEHDAVSFVTDIEGLNAWHFDAERARQVTQPVLYVISGNREAFQRTFLKRFAAWVPQTAEAVIPDTNHALHHRKPREVAEAIRAFLRPHAG